MSSIGAALLDSLRSVERPGDFCVGGVRQIFMPTLDVDGVGYVEGAAAYITTHGVYGYGGSPVALATVHADARRFVAREQADMLEELCGHLGEGAGLHEFILRTVRDDTHRKALVLKMRERAVRHLAD